MDKLFDSISQNKILVDGSNFTGSFGEITIDLTLPGLRVHDGCTCGGMIKITGEVAECFAEKAKVAAEKQAALDAKAAQAQAQQAAAKTLQVEKV